MDAAGGDSVGEETGVCGEMVASQPEMDIRHGKDCTQCDGRCQ